MIPPGLDTSQYIPGWSAIPLEPVRQVWYAHEGGGSLRDLPATGRMYWMLRSPDGRWAWSEADAAWVDDTDEPTLAEDLSFRVSLLVKGVFR